MEGEGIEHDLWHRVTLSEETKQNESPSQRHERRNVQPTVFDQVEVEPAISSSIVDSPDLDSKQVPRPQSLNATVILRLHLLVFLQCVLVAFDEVETLREHLADVAHRCGGLDQRTSEFRTISDGGKTTKVSPKMGDREHLG